MNRYINDEQKKYLLERLKDDKNHSNDNPYRFRDISDLLLYREEVIMASISKNNLP